MKNFELWLRTLLILLTVVLTLQIAKHISIRDLLVIYMLCLVVSIINYFISKFLGISE